MLLTARVFPGNRNKQVAPGHFRWLFHPEQKKKRRSDIGENPIFAAKLGGIAPDVNAMHEICRVRRIRRTVGVAHLFAVPVIGSHDALTAKIKKLRNDFPNAFIHRFHRFDPRFQDAGVANHVRIRKIQHDEIVIRHPGQDLVRDWRRAHFRL